MKYHQKYENTNRIDQINKIRNSLLDRQSRTAWQTDKPTKKFFKPNKVLNRRDRANSIKNNSYIAKGESP